MNESPHIPVDMVQTRIDRISKNLTNLEQKFELHDQFQIEDVILQESQRNDLNDDN